MMDINEQFGYLHASRDESLAADQLLYRPLGVSTAQGEVLIALDSTGHRNVLIPTNRARVQSWATAGIRMEHSTSVGDGHQSNYLKLECDRPRLNAVFGHMVADLARHLASLEPDGDPYASVLNVLEDWKELFARRSGGTSREDQIGIFAELDLLAQLGELSPPEALSAWTASAPGESYRDFQRNGYLLEVKGVVAHSGGHVTVNGLDQLDPEIPGLHLYVARVEIGPGGQTVHERLEELVSGGFPARQLHAQAQARGYTPGPEDLRLMVKDRHVWRLTPGMPFLSLKDIPEYKRLAVTSVSYTMPLGAIGEPSMTDDELTSLLQGMVSQDA